MTSIKSKFKCIGIPALLFLMGIALGTFLWNRIKLPFHNPLEIISPITLMEFNPSNNTLRFILFISLPCLLLAIAFFIGGRRIIERCFKVDKAVHTLPGLTRGKNRLAWVGIILITIIVALNHPTYHAWGKFDFFHEGESLSAAVDYLDGKVPYKESIFYHGLFQDPLRSVTAFKVFGTSIGAERTVESLLKILTFILMSVFLMKIFQKPFYVLVSLFGLGLLDILSRLAFQERVSLYILFSRDIMLFSFLITLFFVYKFLNRKEKKVIKLCFLAALLPFISITALCYSADRGLYLCIAYIFLAIISFLFLIDRHQRRIFITSSLSGIGLALVIIGLLIQWSFKSFFMYLWFLFRDSGLTYGLVFPIFKPRYFTAISLIALLMFWLFFKFLQTFHESKRQFLNSTKGFLNTYCMEFSLLVLSILFFMSAMGRSDAQHLAYSLILPIIFVIHISIRYINRFYEKHRRLINRIFVVILFLFTTFSIYSFVNQNLLSQNFPLDIEDSQFIPDRYKEPLLFLKSNLATGEDVYIFSSEMAWYYLLNKSAPTKIANLQMATSPNFQKQIVKDLKKKNVKFILYQSYSWDNIEHIEKYPILTDYIQKNFKPYKDINGFHIWMGINNIQWDDPEVIPSPRKSSSWFPDLAVDSKGNSHVVWCETRGPADKRNIASHLGETLYYSVWDRKKWKKPEQLLSPQKHIARNAITGDTQDRMHLVFRGPQNVNHVLLPPKLSGLLAKDGVYSGVKPFSFSNQGVTYMSDIAIHNDMVHIVYDRTVKYGDHEGCSDIFYIRHLTDKQTWSEPVNMYPSETGSARAQIKIEKKGTIHITWDEGWDRLSGKGEPRYGVYRCSLDNGNHWSEPLIIDYPSSTNAQLTCGADGNGGVMLVWRTTQLEDSHLYFSWSADYGKNWSPPQKIPSVFSRWYHQTPFDIYDMASDSTGCIHLLAVGHLKKERILKEIPKLFHLIWDGQKWSSPKVIYESELYPEYPRLVIHNGTELHTTFFTREQLWKNHDEAQHQIWYVRGIIVEDCFEDKLEESG